MRPWARRCADRVADRVGLGWWVGFEGDVFLGCWDLGRSGSIADAPVGIDQVEIGWRVIRRHWMKGLATEGASLGNPPTRSQWHSLIFGRADA